MCNDLNSPPPAWWERTVEYFFMANFFGRSNASIFPLAGPTETALGDAVYAKANEYSIIEFKVDKFNINTEFKKYDPNQLDGLSIEADLVGRYEAYQKAVQMKYEPHLPNDFLEPHNMVYSSLNNNPEELKLHIAEYWNCEIEVDEPITSPPHQFWYYAQALAQTRKKSKQGRIPKGIVLGVNGNEIVTLTSLNFLLDVMRDKQNPSKAFKKILKDKEENEPPDMKPW